MKSIRTTLKPSSARRSRSAGLVQGRNGGSLASPERFTPRRITTRPRASTKCLPSVRSEGMAPARAGGETCGVAGKCQRRLTGEQPHRGRESRRPPRRGQPDSRLAGTVGIGIFRNAAALGSGDWPGDRGPTRGGVESQTATAPEAGAHRQPGPRRRGAAASWRSRINLQDRGRWGGDERARPGGRWFAASDRQLLAGLKGLWERAANVCHGGAGIPSRRESWPRVMVTM